jgi:putative aminopeptidase FrvX
MLYTHLKELISAPSVCGYEKPIIEYLSQRGKDNNIPTQTFEKNGVIFGNPNAPTYFIAHIDEVGAWVSYVDDSTIHLESKWRVSPSMLIGREVEILAAQGPIRGLVSSSKLLSMEEEDIHKLIVSVDPSQRQYIQRGDAVRYVPQYTDLPESIIATGLDNKLGVCAAMQLALDSVGSDFLQSNAICLCSEEEDKNQWAMYFMKKFMPRRQIVIDISPMSDEIKNDPHRAIFISSTQDYTLASNYIGICKEAGFEEIQTILGILNRSEAMQYQNITKGIWININIPVYNYHLGSYFVYKDAIQDFERCLKKLIDSLPAINTSPN